MKLAIIGADEVAVELTQEAARQGSQIVLLAELPAADDQRPWGRELRRLAPAAKREEDWLALFDRRAVDAVYVSRADDDNRRVEQLRRLMQMETPLLVAHPLFRSSLDYYELDLVREEHSAIVVPYLPFRWHPAAAELKRLAQAADSPLGKLIQFSIERRNDGATPETVSRFFAHDVDSIRFLVGEPVRLGAMSGKDAAGESSTWNVQMATADGVLLRWSAAAARGEEYRLQLVGSRSEVVLTFDGGEAWTLRLLGDSQAEHAFSQRPARAALDQLNRAIGGAAVEPSWLAAARSVELRETFERSLIKGRTIELRSDDRSEAGTFKGMMTAAGCGLLLAALPLFLIVALLEQAGLVSRHAWAYALLAVLAGFLSLQGLLFLARGRGDRETM